MNNLISKCLEELAKDTPRLDYVRGILETLNEIGEFPSHLLVKKEEKQPIVFPISPSFPEPLRDEGQVLDAIARAKVGKLSAEAELMQP